MSNLDHDLDVLDAVGVDELSDMPEFKAWPNGTYLINLETTIDLDESEDEDGNEIERRVPKATISLVEVVEMEKKDAVAPEAGASFRKSFYLKKKNGERNTYSEGEFKLILAAVAHMFPEAANNGERFELANGVQLVMTTKATKRKNRDTGDIREENTIKALVDPTTVS